MRRTSGLLVVSCCLILVSFGRGQAQDASLTTKLTGKWIQHYTGMSLQGAVLNITSVDPATGLLKGQWIPPTGAAAGKEFEVVGWVSSAPPREKLDNVITISFSVSLTTYGSITSYTGYFKDNKITASWFNIKPNTTYEWDHISTGQDIFTRETRIASEAGQAPTQEKPVDEIFKNIKVLNGMPQSQLYPAMRFMAASLGFQCGSCHVIGNSFGDFPADDKPEKQTARDMIRMVQYINKNYADGNPTVSCYTCHRGSRSPVTAPTLPLQLAVPIGVSSSAASPLPSVDEVLNKYLDAIGGKAAGDLITSCVVKGTTTTAIGQTVAYESEQLAPDKGRESFTLPSNTGRPCAGDSRCEYARVINGSQGWLKSGAGVQELVGQQLDDQKLSFPLFGILRLRDQYASFRISGRDKIDDRDVYVISAVLSDNKVERLYFDVESGLLRRRVGYTRTLIGTIPQQTDFEDYREVQGVRLPFTITMAFVDSGSLPIVRKFAEIKINVPVDASKFDKPLALTAPNR
ncbi:MAG TPA: c-type cytochrome [Pyrinomonadaceae bacterium]|jgi:hypothetical protein|nr:c-type cytochrome [Pyrinomonadaceae bacterium]